MGLLLSLWTLFNKIFIFWDKNGVKEIKVLIKILITYFQVYIVFNFADHVIPVSVSGFHLLYIIILIIFVLIIN